MKFRSNIGPESIIKRQKRSTKVFQTLYYATYNIPSSFLHGKSAFLWNDREHKVLNVPFVECHLDRLKTKNATNCVKMFIDRIKYT